MCKFKESFGICDIITRCYIIYEFYSFIVEVEILFLFLLKRVLSVAMGISSGLKRVFLWDLDSFLRRIVFKRKIYIEKEEKRLKKVLTIGGSDCSGGAGIQADLKTFSAHKLYGMSAITALTAQNTVDVFAVEAVSPKFLEQQLDAVFMDINPDAVKIGMVPNKELVSVIAGKIREYGVRNVVVDPVMVSTTGIKLAQYDVVTTMITQLFPLCSVITPNIPEAKVLCGMEITNKDEMLKAAEKIQEIVFVPILLKGGHLADCADDLLYYGGEIYWFPSRRVNTKNNHGTGCTLSAAIASQLANDQTLEQSIRLAKVYLTGAMSTGLDLGTGAGPLNHFWNS